MLSLPAPNDSLLKGFWVLLSAAVGLAVGVLLWVGGSPHPALWGLAIAVGGTLVGWRRPAVAARPYAAWNRFTRGVRRLARLWLTGVALLMLAVIGRAGSRIATRPPDPAASGWVPKRYAGPDGYPGMSDLPHGSRGEAGWLRSFLTWSWRSGDVWAASLVPVLLLLRWVEDRPRGSFGGNVYTLY